MSDEAGRSLAPVRVSAVEELPAALAGAGLAGGRPVVVLVGGAGGMPAAPDAAALEPHHSLFLLVPGTEWGDEAPWISDVATALAAGRPSVTVLVNGGRVAYTDVRCSLDAGRPVLVLAGTGRTADAIAHAARGGDPRAVEIAASPLVGIVDVGAPDAVAAALETALAQPARRTTDRWSVS